MAFFGLFGKKKKEKYEAVTFTNKKNEPQYEHLKEEVKPPENPERKIVEVRPRLPKEDGPKKAETKTDSLIDEPDDKEIESAETVSKSTLTRNGNFEIKKAKDGRYFFNLCASNKVVIAYSQIYSSSTSAVNGIKSIIANAPRAEIEDTTLKKPVCRQFPKWEIYLDKAGKHRFRLYAPNGSCVCHSSRGYATKATCKGGIESIIRFAVEDADINKAYLK